MRNEIKEAMDRFHERGLTTEEDELYDEYDTDDSDVDAMAVVNFFAGWNSAIKWAKNNQPTSPPTPSTH